MCYVAVGLYGMSYPGGDARLRPLLLYSIGAWHCVVARSRVMVLMNVSRALLAECMARRLGCIVVMCDRL